MKQLTSVKSSSPDSIAEFWKWSSQAMKMQKRSLWSIPAAQWSMSASSILCWTTYLCMLSKQSHCSLKRQPTIIRKLYRISNRTFHMLYLLWSSLLISKISSAYVEYQSMCAEWSLQGRSSGCEELHLWHWEIAKNWLYQPEPRSLDLCNGFQIWIAVSILWIPAERSAKGQVLCVWDHPCINSVDILAWSSPCHW